MKERPILFSAPMVQAILSGNKTQTRRIVKHQPKHLSRVKAYLRPDGLYKWVLETGMGDGTTRGFFSCPYGIVGDRLWVRETWAKTMNTESGFEYRADYTHEWDIEREFSWRSSIFMPRQASRISLEVVNVRTEMLVEISDSDCEAEGVRPSVDGNAHDWRENESGWVRTYRQLWESINGPGSWDANPWVWVIEFKVVS